MGGDIPLLGASVVIAIVGDVLVLGRLALTLGTLVGVIVALVSLRLSSVMRKGARGWGKPSTLSRLMQLPPLSSILVGRSEELADLVRLVKGSGGVRRRVAVLYGPAGIGKSTLAIAAGRLLAPSFTGGVLYACLSDYPDRDRAIDGVTDSFVAALAGRYRTKLERSAGLDQPKWTLWRRVPRLLVLLDDVPDADWIKPLLPRNSRDFVLITSRNALKLDGPVVQTEIRGLSGEAGLELLRHAVGDRVEKERGAAERIVERANGFPLALKLAAEPLVNRPDFRLDHLIARLETSATRTGGVAVKAEESSLDLSFALLSAKEQRALLALGVRGKEWFAPWMLAGMLGIDRKEAARITSCLAESRFAERCNSSTDGISEFRLHDHVLTYIKARALHELTPVERSVLISHLAEAKLARYEVDRSRGLRDTASANYIAGDLFGAIRAARNAIRLSRESEDLDGLGRGLSILAEVHAELGDFALARGLVNEVSAIGEEAGVLARMRSERTLGKVHRRLHQASLAVRHLERSLVFCDGLPETISVTEKIRTLRELSVARTLETGGNGLAEVERAFDLCKTIPAREADGLKAGLGWAKARSQRAMNRSAAAEETLKWAAQSARQQDQRLWSAWIKLQQATLALDRGDRSPGQMIAQEALRSFAVMRHRYGTAESRVILGKAMSVAGDHERAAQLLTEALETFQNCGDQWMAAEASWWLARELKNVIDRRAEEENDLLINAERAFEALGDRQRRQEVNHHRLNLPLARPRRGRFRDLLWGIGG